MYTNLLCFHTLTMKYQRELRKQSHLQSKRIKYRGVNLTMEVKDPYIENSKTLMK